VFVILLDGTAKAAPYGWHDESGALLDGTAKAAPYG